MHYAYNMVLVHTHCRKCLPNDMAFEDMSTMSTSFTVRKEGLLWALNSSSNFTLPLDLWPAHRQKGE